MSGDTPWGAILKGIEITNKLGFDIYDRAMSLSQYNRNYNMAKSMNDWNKGISLYNAYMSSQAFDYQKKQDELNRAFAREQFDYQKDLNQTLMDREDTAYQRQVKDMQAAGINPILSSGATAQSLGATSIGSSGSASFSGASGASGQSASGSSSGSVPDLALADFYLQAKDQEFYRQNAQNQYDLASQQFEEEKEKNKSSSEQWQKQYEMNKSTTDVMNRIHSATADSMEMHNEASKKVYNMTGLTLDDLKTMNWQTAAGIIGILKGSEVKDSLSRNREDYLDNNGSKDSSKSDSDQRKLPMTWEQYQRHINGATQAGYQDYLRSFAKSHPDFNMNTGHYK